MPSARTSWRAAKTLAIRPLSLMLGRAYLFYFSTGATAGVLCNVFSGQHSSSRDIYLKYPASKHLSAFNTGLYHTDQQELVLNNS